MGDQTIARQDQMVTAADVQMAISEMERCLKALKNIREKLLQCQMKT